MRQLTDFQGRSVRLTDERLAHILGHPEMAGFDTQIDDVLRNPETVVRSRTDPTVNLCYRFYAQTAVGGKWLCVVVKYVLNDAFVLTAYLTDKIKAGEIWFDAEGDFLEVLFSDKAGFMRETDEDALMERVDEQGNLLGFSILNVSRLAADHRPLIAQLPSKAAG
jgi:hypothetical protein